MRPVNAVAESMRPKRSSAACTSRADESGFDRSRTPSTTSTAGTQFRQLGDKPFRRITNYQVVIPGGEEPR